MNLDGPPAIRKRIRDESILSIEDIEILSGRKEKMRQCEALRAMKIPFAINILREPLVPRSAIEGTAAEARREVKLLQQHIDVALHGQAQHHIQAYRDDVGRCTGVPWKAV